MPSDHDMPASQSQMNQFFSPRREDEESIISGTKRARTALSDSEGSEGLGRVRLGRFQEHPSDGVVSTQTRRIKAQDRAR